MLLTGTAVFTRLLLAAFTLPASAIASDWAQWWSYDGISGPAYWGVMNLGWPLCQRGKYQSPINIDPTRILHDPNLTPLKFARKRISGRLVNSGQDIRMAIDKIKSKSLYLSGGPLTYTYRIAYMAFHFGNKDAIGSEHQIANRSFPLEIQLIGYNSDLFANMKTALTSSFGIAILSVFGQIAQRTNSELRKIIREMDHIRFKGESRFVTDIATDRLLPNISHFLTYDGSMTQPGCEEVVTWIILNKPIYISRSDIKHIRSLCRSKESEGTFLLKNTFRPTWPVNNRTVRTNIPPPPEVQNCQPRVLLHYEVNSRFVT